jgi:hypothetical protein
MAGGRDDRVPPHSTFAARWRRALLFVGVCWSLAAALLLLQDGWAELLNLAVAHGWLPDRLVMRGPPTVAVDCSAAAAAAQGLQANPELWRPLTESSIDALPGASPKEKVLAHLERITQHLQGGG